MKAERVKVSALIPAAGLGTRLGRGPKALVQLRGQSLLDRSLKALEPLVDQMLVAWPPELELPMQTQATFIHGGQTRQQSVYHLLQAAQGELVLIHDAARPFLAREVVQRLLEAVSSTGAVTAALPVADTLVRAVAGERWGELTPREGLWAVQTPQVFQRELLRRAHWEALQAGFSATDDAGLMVWLGQPVQLVPGDARLFKITQPSDLLLAEALAQAWDRDA